MVRYGCNPILLLLGDRWPLGSIACETWLFLDYTLCLVSILTVLLITADRYLSVCHTAKYLKWQSPTKTQILIVLSWIIPAVIFGVMIYGWAFIVGVEDERYGNVTRPPTKVVFANFERSFESSGGIGGSDGRRILISFLFPEVN